MSMHQMMNPARQRGATAIEFALVSVVFFTVLIGIMEMGRVFFYLNTASEATRLGARLAVVCDANDTAIKEKMARLLPLLTPDRINISYEPPLCAASALTARASCRSVTVSVAPSLTVDTVIPFVPFTLSMPAFATTLPRESLNSTDNAVCT